MGVEQTDSSKLLLQRQGLHLELDAVIAKDIGPDVGLGRSLQFGMPELEDDLGLADGEGLTAAKMKDCRWVKLVLVGQFEFTEWTPDNHLRHSRFIELRADKKPKEVVREG